MFNTLIKIAQFFGFFKTTEVFSKIKLPVLNQLAPLVTNSAQVKRVRDELVKLQSREKYLTAVGIAKQNDEIYHLNISLARSLTVDEEKVISDLIGNVSTEFFALRELRIGG